MASGESPPVTGGVRTTTTKQAREGKVLDSVLDLLREGGYRAVTTGAVAARAGVSKETIYRTWRNKSELVVAALGVVLQPLDVPDLGSLELELVWLQEQRLKQYEQADTGRLLASLIGATAQDQLLAESFRRWARHQRTINTRIFQRAIERGELKLDCPIDNLVTLLAAPMAFRLVWEGRIPDHGLIDAVVQCLLSFGPSESEAHSRP
jgi:AcrR family transcriptional regulator